MRASAQDELDRLLEATGGDPASLSLVDRARLDALLAELANDIAAPGETLGNALAAAEREVMPSRRDWERVWSAIEAAGAASESVERRRSLIYRLRLPAVVGLAAALVFAITLALPRSTTDSTSPIRLATNVEIHELEVSDGTPFVVSVGSNGAEVVWVLRADG